MKKRKPFDRCHIGDHRLWTRKGYNLCIRHARLWRRVAITWDESDDRWEFPELDNDIDLSDSPWAKSEDTREVTEDLTFTNPNTYFLKPPDRTLNIPDPVVAGERLVAVVDALNGLVEAFEIIDNTKEGTDE